MDNTQPINTTQPSMIPLSQATPDNPYLEAYKASIAQPVISLESSQAGLAQEERAVAQQQFFSQAQAQLQQSRDPNTGYVDPSIYNKIKNQAGALGIPSDTFDQNFEHDYTDPTQITYNTSTGYANRTALGGVTRQIEAKLLQYAAIPQNQKGPILGKLADIPILGQYLAPEATTYEGERTGLAAQLKSLLGGATGIRVTAAQLEGWSNLIPTAEDTPQVANDKILALDRDIKATFNSPQGLHPSFLPQQTGQSPQIGQTSQDAQNPQSNPQEGSAIPGVNIPPATNSMTQFVNNFDKTNQTPSNPLTGAIQFGLPTLGALGGGALGAAIPGLDLTGAPEIAGAAAGGAGGQALADLLTGKQPGADVLTTGALTAAGGVGGKLLGGVLSKFGGAATDYGEGLISKGLNLTPKMTSDVTKDMGVDSLSGWLTKNGLQGADYEKIQAAVAPVQDAFDAIAKNPDITIKPSSVTDAFDKQISDLQNSLLPADKAKAKVLQAISNNFTQKFGNVSQIGADTLTALRIGVDKTVSDFGADPLVSSTGNLTRSILQKSIQDADPSNSLDALGTKLHQFYTLLGKAEPRQFVGQGKPLVGVKDAAAALVGNIFAGPVGAAAGFGLDKVASSPLGVNAISKGAMGLGQILGNPLISKGATGLGITGGSGLGAIFGGNPKAQ